jgi:hypothetical protein
LTGLLLLPQDNLRVSTLEIDHKGGDMLDAVLFDRVNHATGKSDPNGTHFVAEAAEIGLRPGQAPPPTFSFQNCPLPGMSRCFHLVKTDVLGGDGDDVMGWRYEEDNGPNKGNTSYKDPGNPQSCPPFTVLIIND